MLLRASNAVGYTNYPDNVVRDFVAQAGRRGHRPLPRLRLPELGPQHARGDGRRARVGDAAARRRSATPATSSTRRGTKYDLAYYVELAKELEAAGAHILGIKDMAGLCKPDAARMLVQALREEVGHPDPLPHPRHGGLGRASVLAAAEVGLDVADAAMASMCGLTSQPSLDAIVEALRGSPRDTGLAREPLARVADYWEAVRSKYAAFESDMRAGTAEVYEHEMPGGQYTNLRQQARALGLEARWREVARGLRRRQPAVRRHRQGHARPRRSSATWPSSWSPTT